MFLLVELRLHENSSGSRLLEFFSNIFQKNVHLQLKEKARNNVKVVTCEWLLDCAKAHAVLDAKDYLIFRQEPREYESLKGTSSEVTGRSVGFDPPRKKPKLKITQVQCFSSSFFCFNGFMGSKNKDVLLAGKLVTLIELTSIPPLIGGGRSMNQFNVFRLTSQCVLV